MSTPIHKTCYRCDRALPELIEPADVRGGLHGQCSDCRLRLAAEDLARKWHALHPELPCVPVGGESRITNYSGGTPIGKPEASQVVDILPGRFDDCIAVPCEGAAEIPRGMPVCLRCGAPAGEVAGLWWCPNEACVGFHAGVPETLPEVVLTTEHTKKTGT